MGRGPRGSLAKHGAGCRRLVILCNRHDMLNALSVYIYFAQTSSIITPCLTALCHKLASKCCLFVLSHSLAYTATKATPII